VVERHKKADHPFPLVELWSQLFLFALHPPPTVARANQRVVAPAVRSATSLVVASANSLAACNGVDRDVEAQQPTL